MSVRLECSCLHCDNYLTDKQARAALDKLNAHRAAGTKPRRLGFLTCELCKEDLPKGMRAHSYRLVYEDAPDLYLPIVTEEYLRKRSYAK